MDTVWGSECTPAMSGPISLTVIRNYGDTLLNSLNRARPLSAIRSALFESRISSATLALARVSFSPCAPLPASHARGALRSFAAFAAFRGRRRNPRHGQLGQRPFSIILRKSSAACSRVRVRAREMCQLCQLSRPSASHPKAVADLQRLAKIGRAAEQYRPAFNRNG